MIIPLMTLTETDKPFKFRLLLEAANRRNCIDIDFVDEGEARAVKEILERAEVRVRA